MNETGFTIVLIILEIIFSLAVLRALGKAGLDKTRLITIGLVLVAWLALMYGLISQGFFSSTAIPQISFSIAVVIPVIIAYAIIRMCAPLRQAVASMRTEDFLRLQYWRTAFGALFFFTAALPVWFKFVGGLGDIAAGVGAFAALAYFHKHPEQERKTIIRGNLIGILDFIVVFALGVGVVLQDQSPDMPFDLIPLYVVPIFILLHIFSLQRLATIK